MLASFLDLKTSRHGKSGHKERGQPLYRSLNVNRGWFLEDRNRLRIAGRVNSRIGAKLYSEKARSICLVTEVFGSSRPLSKVRQRPKSSRGKTLCPKASTFELKGKITIELRLTNATKRSGGCDCYRCCFFVV